MNKDDNKNNLEENRKQSHPVAVYMGALLGALWFTITLETKDSPRVAEEYLESLESNHDLNKKLDALIEEFSPRFGNIRLGDKLEEYLGISLDSSKKQRLEEIALELDDMKAVAEDRMSISHFEEVQGHDVFQKVNEVISENIMEDNELDSNVSIQFGKDYGWVVADEYYQIFDETLNEYASSYEVLNSYNPNNNNREEYQNIVSGVLKSCLCDIILDEDNNRAKIVIPEEVKTLVKTRID